jgi:hypothetical protein
MLNKFRLLKLLFAFSLFFLLVPLASAGTCTIFGNVTQTQSDLNGCAGGTLDDLVVNESVTLTLSEAITVVNSVTVNGTINHVAEDADGVNITATTLTVAASGSIDTDEKGCPSSESPNSSTNICANGGTSQGYGEGGYAYNAGGGAGHGGRGSNSAASGIRGYEYGSALNPVLSGSGGGESLDSIGGKGGGLVRLSISGTLTNSGAISANGGVGTITGDHTGGGGSGGSINVSTLVLAGSGDFEAIGGNGIDTTQDSGAGGGGRIKITTGSLSGISTPLTDLEGMVNVSGGVGYGTVALGSNGSAIIIDDAVDTTNHTDATVYIYDGFDFISGEENGSSEFEFANMYIYGTTATTDDVALGIESSDANITIQDGGVLEMSNVDITCTSVTTLDFTVGSSTGTFDLNNRSASDATTLSCSGTDVTFTVASSLTTTIDNFTSSSGTIEFDVPDATYIFTDGNITATDAEVAAGIEFSDDISLEMGTNSGNNTAFSGNSTLTLDAFTVYSGSSWAATELGCPNTESPDGSNVCDAANSGDGAYGYNGGGGGSHGGLGTAAESGGGPGSTYGSNTDPVLFGSGGGNSNYATGGLGGGLLYFTVGGTFTHNGTMTVNGGLTGSGAAAGGGGSGGSIFAVVGTFAGSGTFVSNGGAATQTQGYLDSGAGGGGRISVQYGSTGVGDITTLMTVSGGAGIGDVSAGAVGTKSSTQVVSLTSSTITDSSGYTNDTTPEITLVEGGATPTHVAFSCNNSDWSTWLTYPDDDVVNDVDGPEFNITSGATNCTATEELKTIYAKIKDGSSESVVRSDTTTYDVTAPSVSNVSSTKDNGTYGASIVIPVTVQFNETVNVGGTPKIQLDFDGTDRGVGFSSGTGTDTLTFNYTTVNGDNKTDLDYTGTDALSLNGGTITDTAGNTATLTLATPGEANSLGANKEINVSTNQDPTAATVTPAMTTDGTGDVTITFIMDDPDDDDTLQAKIEYSDDGGSTWNDPDIGEDDTDTTATYGDPDIDNDAATYQVGQSGAYITSSSGANTVSIVWEAATDVASSTDITDAQIRVTPYDGTAAGTVSTSSDFILDVVDPTGLTALTNLDANIASVTLTWTAPTETNFDHYEIWYGDSQSDVQNRTGTATEWDDSDDGDLSTKATTSTTITTDPRNKYFKIWAVDGPGNIETVDDILVTISGGSSSLDIGIPTNLSVTDNPGGGVILTWEDPTDDDSAYINIHRGISPYPVDGTSMVSVVTGTESYIDTDPNEGDTVTYMLRAANGGHLGDLTEGVTFRVGSTYMSFDDTDTGGSSGGGGGGGGSSSDDDDDGEEDEEDEEEYEDCIIEDDDGESLEDLGLDTPDHWSEGYLKHLGEDDRIVAAAVETVSFFELLTEILTGPNEGMNRGKALELLLVLGGYDVTKSIVNTFTDVTADHVRGYMIEFAAEHNLINGYPDNTFQPENTVNRVEALKMSAYFFGLEAPELYGDDLLDFYYIDEEPFTDVDFTAWYAPYLIFAYSNGVVSGYGDGTFGPANNVTFAEFVKIATLMRDVDNAVELSSCLE